MKRNILDHYSYEDFEMGHVDVFICLDRDGRAYREIETELKGSFCDRNVL